jgi:hypothetical protein
MAPAKTVAFSARATVPNIIELVFAYSYIPECRAQNDSGAVLLQFHPVVKLPRQSLILSPSY